MVHLLHGVQLVVHGLARPLRVARGRAELVVHALHDAQPAQPRVRAHHAPVGARQPQQQRRRPVAPRLGTFLRHDEAAQHCKKEAGRERYGVPAKRYFPTAILDMTSRDGYTFD